MVLAAGLLASGCGESKPPPQKPRPAGCPEGMASIAAMPGGERFCIDRTEVTVSAYADCEGKGKCTAVGKGRGCNRDDLSTQNHPSNCVSYAQAEAFCKAVGKRLPTSKEWEWVAGGAGEGAGRGDGCTSADEPRHATCAVSRRDGGDTPQGVSGMAGNVAEWTSTPGPEAGTRVVRGGSFGLTGARGGDATLSVTAREQGFSGGVGFRCAAVFVP